MEKVKCTKCKKSKTFKDFYKDSNRSNGLTSACKACHKKVRQLNRLKNAEYQRKLRSEDPERVKQSKRNSWRNLDPRKKMLQQAKNRCRRNSIEFDLVLEDIVISDKCPLLGVDFIIGVKHDYQYTYSLDRINPDKGYTKGNVWVISMLANSMKNNATKEQLLTFADNIYKYFKDDDIVQPTGKPVELEDKELLG
jgi:hypothetical protein